MTDNEDMGRLTRKKNSLKLDPDWTWKFQSRDLDSNDLPGEKMARSMKPPGDIYKTLENKMQINLLFFF